MSTQKAMIATVFICGLLSPLLSLDSVAVGQDKKEVPKIRRVKRPKFGEATQNGVFFKDLFLEGLVGKRPAKLAPGQKPVIPGIAKSTPDTGKADDTSAVGFQWSKLISASSLEDEVKSLQQSLSADITTPSKFKSDYAKVHQSYSILSMLFAVVREYDSEVRWKKFASVAQASFEKAAANSRVGTIQAYESCKRRAEDLKEMVRGGNFAGTDKPAESLDWSTVVGHSPIMKQLKSSYGKLKPLVSNKTEFESNVTEVMRHAELIAVMSHAVTIENMDFADDDGYVAYAKAMLEAANKAAEGCRTSDFDSVSKGVNLIGQSCSNCHDEYR